MDFLGFGIVGLGVRTVFWEVPVELVVALKAVGKGTSTKGALSRATQRKQWERFVRLAAHVRFNP